MKLLEGLYKSASPLIRLICRENLIEMAKEKGIFVETPTRKEPNEDELAKTAYLVIIDKSIPVMREKKANMEKNEENKKLKEELIFKINNPEPVDAKKPPPKVDKKQVVTNPDEIKIISDEEFCDNVDLYIIFYNYPQTPEEFKSLENEKIYLNHTLLTREMVK